jgi:hypothetical protein
MQDVENKLLEANLEIKKLVEMNNISNISINNGNNKPNIVKLNEHNRGTHIPPTPPPSNFKVPTNNTSNNDSNSPKNSDVLSIKENKDNSNNNSTEKIVITNNRASIISSTITPVVNNDSTITKQVEKNEPTSPTKEVVSSIPIQKTSVDDSEKIDASSMLSAKDKIAAMFALKGPQKPQ